MAESDPRSPRSSPTPPPTPPPAPPLHHPQPRRPNNRAAVLPSPQSIPTARPVPQHAKTAPQGPRNHHAQEPVRAQTLNSQRQQKPRARPDHLTVPAPSGPSATASSPSSPTFDDYIEGDSATPTSASSAKSFFGAIAKGIKQPLSRRRSRREADEWHAQRVNSALESGTGHRSLEDLLRAEAIEEEVRRARERGPRRGGIGRDRGASDSGLPDHLVKVGYDADEGVHHVVDTTTGKMMKR